MTGKGAAREICYIGLFVAILAVCAWIHVKLPSGVSVTMQTLGVCLAGTLLGVKRGVICVAAYLALGCFGVPVFSGFLGGAGVLTGPTGGYLLGFLFTAACAGAVKDKGAKETFLGCSIGVLCCYLFGTLFFALLSGTDKSVSFFGALTVCVLPYVIPDLIKLTVVVFLTEKLKKSVRF